MKKMLDKPYKTVIYLFVVLLFGVIALENKTNIDKPVKVTKQIIKIEEPHKMIAIQTSIEEKSLSVQQTRRDNNLSRGGNPPKELTEREIINTYVRDIATKYKLEPTLIMSVIQTESRYNPKAKNGNCLGLMQVSTRWHADRAARLGVKDFYDPYSNVLLGVDYISELLSQYKDIRLVLMLYNMDHKTALKLFADGQITEYATTILARAEEYKKGE